MEIKKAKFKKTALVLGAFLMLTGLLILVKMTNQFWMPVLIYAMIAFGAISADYYFVESDREKRTAKGE